MSKHESGWSYVLRRLIDTPGLTALEMIADRPEHLNAGSVGKDCSRLFAMGVLSRAGRRKPGHRGGPEYVYSVADLDKLPPGMKWDGKPGCGQGPRRSPVDRADSEIRGVYDHGPEQDLDPGPAPSKEWVTWPKSDTAPVALPYVQGHDEYTPRTPAGPVAPMPAGPRIVVDTPKGQRVYSLAHARALYLQLKEVFG